MTTEQTPKKRSVGEETKPLPEADTEPTTKPSTRPDNGLVATLVAWYAASVVCTNTSKSLGLPWQWLTLAQLVIGSLSAYFGIAVLRLNGKQMSNKPLKEMFPTSQPIWQSTTILAACFVGGFITLNMALRQMHVSTVMTVRAAEPVATLLLGLYFLPHEKTTRRAVLALVPVVAGAAMASTVGSGSDDDHQDTYFGLAIVLLCNCLFALRTIFTKRLKATCPALDNFTLFFQLCVIGTILQSVLLCGMKTFHALNPQSTADSTNSYSTTTLWAALRGGDDDMLLFNLTILLLNGISFYAYLQLSWVVMGQVGAVTHSVCNALRRPVICAAGWILFGGATLEGVTGALVATGGTLLYAQAKRQAATKAEGPLDNDTSHKAKLTVV